MIRAPRRNRLSTALRLALYPAFEPREAVRFEALRMEAENARGAGDLAKAEELYLSATVKARDSSDPSLLIQWRHGLGRVYQEQHKYRDAEQIFREQFEDALNSSQPNSRILSGHMCLASLYQDDGRFAEAEEHYKAAVAVDARKELRSGRGFFCRTSMSLAKFYVAQHRYSEAEPLYQRAAEFYEEDRGPNSYLPHHLEEFAELYDLQENYVAAEQLRLRALKTCQQCFSPNSGRTIYARDNLAASYRARRRYAKAEALYRESLAIVEENVRSEVARWTKGRPRRRKRKEFDALINRSRMPVSGALDRLAEVCEDQEKYAEAAPLRKRSLEIKEQAWCERSWIWVDSIAAYADVLHKLGREQEASGVDDRVKAIRAKHRGGSAAGVIRFSSQPIKRSFRWRVSAFVRAILHPSQY